MWHRSNIVCSCLSWQQTAVTVVLRRRSHHNNINSGLSSDVFLNFSFYFRLYNQIIKTKKCSSRPLQSPIILAEVLFYDYMAIKTLVYLCLDACSYSLCVQTRPALPYTQLLWRQKSNLAAGDKYVCQFTKLKFTTGKNSPANDSVRSHFQAPRPSTACFSPRLSSVTRTDKWRTRDAVDVTRGLETTSHLSGKRASDIALAHLRCHSGPGRLLCGTSTLPPISVDGESHTRVLIKVTVYRLRRPPPPPPPPGPLLAQPHLFSPSYYTQLLWLLRLVVCHLVFCW